MRSTWVPPSTWRTACLRCFTCGPAIGSRTLSQSIWSGAEPIPELTRVALSDTYLGGPGAVVKVLDMGLARVTSAGEQNESWSTLTVAGTFMGTPDFMAPEQWENPHTTDIRADVYSLGCTLYHLLAGRAPFAGGSIAQKILKHQQAEPDPPDDQRPTTARPTDPLQAPLEPCSSGVPGRRYPFTSVQPR